MDEEEGLNRSINLSKPMKAIILARVSTEEQMNEGQSIPAQLSCGVLISTIDFYVRRNLLKPVSFSQGNYRLFNKQESLRRLKKIKELQKDKRLTIKEIAKHFKTKK